MFCNGEEVNHYKTDKIKLAQRVEIYLDVALKAYIKKDEPLWAFCPGNIPITFHDFGTIGRAVPISFNASELGVPGTISVGDYIVITGVNSNPINPALFASFSLTTDKNTILKFTLA